MYSNSDKAITLNIADEMAFDIGTMVSGGTDVDRASKMVYDAYGLTYMILEGVE